MAGKLDKVVLVTGATDGLGRAFALALARHGTTVLVHRRDQAKGEALLGSCTKRHTGGQVPPGRFRRPRGGCRRWPTRFWRSGRGSTCWSTTPASAVEDSRRESRDGHGMLFAVDYLAPYLLTHRLLPLLERSVPARVINVASAGQAPIDFGNVMLERDWSGVQSYCRAKLALVMMAFDMADRLRGRGVTINALHPASMMPTKIVVGRFGTQSTVDGGVRNLLRLAMGLALDGVTGHYFNRGKEVRADGQACDPAALAKLRTLSDRLCGTGSAASVAA